jgi:hypothetical protein
MSIKHYYWLSPSLTKGRAVSFYRDNKFTNDIVRVERPSHLAAFSTRPKKPGTSAKTVA